jgi:Methyltransferase domain
MRRFLNDKTAVDPSSDSELISQPSSAPYPHVDFPALKAKHVRNARLYCDRKQMVRALELKPGCVIGEVGVAGGRFSTFLIDHLKPAEFVAFDLFNLHNIPILWGQPTSVLFEGKTQLEYFRDKLIGKHAKVVVEEGRSHEMLAKYPDGYFDMLYIDAGHTYEDVKRDAEVSKNKVKVDGLLVFNDYIMFDHLVSANAYGVVPAVNELVVKDDWEVVAFALQKQMFCDIAIRRIVVSKSPKGRFARLREVLRL